MKHKTRKAVGHPNVFMSNTGRAADVGRAGAAALGSGHAGFAAGSASVRLAPAQEITPELRRWIVSQAEAGQGGAALLEAMCASGWDAATAARALQETLPADRRALDTAVPGGVPAQGGLHDAAAPLDLVPGPLPEPAIGDGRSIVVADGHPVRIVTAVARPRVVVLADVLTADECEGLIAASRERLQRSRTVHNESGGDEINASRTSDGMFFERGESALIARIERRIAALVNWPIDHGEGLQVLRYAPGAQYKPHHDYFDPAHAGSATILKRGGQRVATLVMYLQAPERGGATTFPESGIEVAPQRGGAVFFSYESPQPETLTLHGGAPVLAGEKWVATKWLRQGRFV